MKAGHRYSWAMVSGMALGVGVAASALAAPVGGAIAGINTVTPTFNTGAAIVAANGLDNFVLVTGTINNNDENGWVLTVTSANQGRLLKGTGGAGREIVYTNIEFFNTGGTLGTGLNDPSATKNIATSTEGGVNGTTQFYTRATFEGDPADATSATVNYTFQLRIDAAANTSLLSGTYSDDITVSLSNDS